jgi:hypothetical protein
MTELSPGALVFAIGDDYLNPFSDFDAIVYESRSVLCVLEALHADILLSKSLYIEFREIQRHIRE